MLQEMILSKRVLLVCLVLLISGCALAQDPENPMPVSPAPHITNAPRSQEPAEAEKKDKGRPEGNAEKAEPSPAAEPDLEFQVFVATSLGRKLPIFGQNLFENVPSTFAPLEHVQVTPDYLIGAGDELLIRAWGQVDIDWRATVDRSGAIYLPKVGSISVAGVRYENLHEYLQAEIGRVFRNFQLSVTMGRLRSIQVFVVGQARRPGSYTISSLSSLVDALFASGGPSNRGSMRRIQLKRNGRIVTTFDLYDLIVSGDKSKDVKLLPGDVIYVPAVGPLVALAGSVNLPAIYELRDSTTLDDAIRYAGGLTNTAAVERAVVERIDSRRVRKAEEFPLDPEGLALALRDGDVIRFLHISAKFENDITLRGNVAVPGRYPWRPGMRVHDLIPTRESLVTEEYWKQQNQLAVTAQTPGVQRTGPVELKNEVKRLLAEINWDYAVVQRFKLEDLSSNLLPFNLAKAIEGDETQNLPLQPGDVVTILSQADIQVPLGQQSKFVRLEGEFAHSGVYQVQPGETLRQLVSRVGGLTPQSYLFGAELNRESTRLDQQKQLDQYILTLEQAIERSAAGTASASGGDAARAAEAGVRLDAQRNLLAKLKLLRATGRVVLEIRPNAAGPDALPDLVLEDGDRLLIPFTPATVNVIGLVYNSNAFLFKPGKTVGDYLRLAGGPTQDADKGREFVIRANGSSVSRQQKSFLTTSGFDSLPLMPGDAIVVPEKLDRGALLRGFKDWTQIISSFVLGAAAAKVLF